MSTKIEMFKVTASFSGDHLVVEYPSLAGGYLDMATHGELEAELEDCDSVTFTIERIWMTPDEIEVLNESPEFEGFR